MSSKVDTALKISSLIPISLAPLDTTITPFTAGNVAVKLNLLNAVTTLLNITTDQVTVLKGI